jgi:prevent-host-death family protein
MKVFNIHEAKTQLSRLVEQASQGRAFIIARAGKPLVKVVPLDTPNPREIRRLGFLEGAIEVPDDFDELHEPQIEKLFEGQ